MEVSAKTLQIVEYVRSKGEGYLNQATRETKISKPTILKIFNRLASEGVFTCREVAGAKLYSLNQQNVKTKGICMLLDSGKEANRVKNEEAIRSLVKDYLRRKGR